VGQATWVRWKSTRTLRLWCEVDQRNDPDNVLRMIRGQSYTRRFRSSNVTITYPEIPGRHILDVKCPRCGKNKKVLVQILDEEARKWEIRWIYLPLTLLGAGLFWVAAWYFYGQDPSWPNVVALAFLGLVVHFFPAMCVVGLLRADPGLSGRVANLLPADAHTKEEEGKIGWHSLSCFEGDTPDWLTVDELEIDNLLVVDNRKKAEPGAASDDLA